MKQEAIVVEGKIIEAKPNADFLIELKNQHKVLARVSGKMQMNNIKLIVGDLVKLEISPYDLNRGRIVYRYK